MARRRPNTDRVVLLAGAGASAHLGLPTLDDLLKRAVIGNDATADLIRNTRNSIEAEAQRYKKAVFEELIVKIREYLRTLRMLRTDHTLRSSLKSLPHTVDNGMSEIDWRQALTRCYRILLEEYGPGKVVPSSDHFKVTIQLLAALARINEGALRVFTTNYDCSYQVLAAKCSDLSFYTHIDTNTGRFRDQWYTIASPVNLPKIYVHRLHGCVAWYNACADQDDMGVNCGQIVEVYGAGGSLDIQDDGYLNQMCIKLIAAQLVGTNPVFSTAFEEFSDALRRAEILFVWGYSFRDLEVMRQIDLAMLSRKTAKPLKIYYLDPFLNEEQANRNITATFHAVPSRANSRFSPKQIKWNPSLGVDRIPDVVRAELKEALGK